MTSVDYRATLNLPKTDFPMKAELPKREPPRVAWWRERRTYERRLERNAPNGAWILHDGPPYSNGDLHMGHFLNMVLKDMLVKIALLDDKFAKFVPGWDMHGLPIEFETLKYLGITDFHAIDPLELREQCKQRALYWLDRQRDQRVRMGNFGYFDAPYRSIDPSKRRSLTPSPIWRSASKFTRACAPRSGAFTTRRRSRRPKSSTSSAFHRRFTCALLPTKNSAGAF